MHNTDRAAQAGRRVVDNIVQPAIHFILAFGARCAVLLHAMTVAHAHGLAFGDGVSPASMGMVDLPQSQVISYDRNFIDQLRGETPWIGQTTRKTIEQNNGSQLRLYMYQTIGPNTTQAAEGTVGAGLKANVIANTTAIGQYADFINVSDIAIQTVIDPALENLGSLMAYRLAQTCNIIVQNTADASIAVDPTVNSRSKAYNVPLATVDITAVVQSLLGRNVRPLEGGFMGGIIHPYVVGDVLNDNSNNGLVDVIKRTTEGVQRLRELSSSDNESVPVVEWAGVRFGTSTFVKQTPNYQGHAGYTALRTYIIGKDALFTISLGAKDNTNIGDGDWRNLETWVKRLTEPSGYDPARMIGGFASYNAKMAAALVPDSTQRVRIIDSVSNIS